jgi:hypothetical protein
VEVGHGSEGFIPDVHGGVQVPIMGLATVRTGPLTLLEGEFMVQALFGMVADMGRWVPHVHLDDDTVLGLTGLIGELLADGGPRGIMDTLGETVVTDHVLDLEGFHTDHLGLVDELASELVLEGVPGVGYLGMEAS